MKYLPLYDDHATPLAAVEHAQSIDRDTLPAFGVHGRACSRCTGDAVGIRTGLRNPCMPAEGEPGGLLVVGETPTRDEDAVGRPLSSAGGSLVRKLIAKHWAGPVAFDLAVRCAPGAQGVREKHVDLCRGYLAATVAEVAPTRILALGNWAAYALLGRSVSPMSLRRAHAWLRGTAKPVPVFPLVSAGAAMHNRFVRQWLEADIEWALTTPDPAPAPWAVDARIIETDDDARAAEAALMGAAWVAFDVETVGQMWTDAFRVISVAVCADGDDSPWVWVGDALRRQGTLDALRRVLTSRDLPKAGQNVKYDQLAMRAAFGWQVRPIALDTRLQRKLLEPEADGSLGAMSELVGMGGLKEEASEAMATALAKVKRALKKPLNPALPIVEGLDLDPHVDAALRAGASPDDYRFWLMSGDVLARYNARDAVATARLGVALGDDIKREPDLARTWRTIVRPAAVALERIEAWGVPVSRDAIVAFDDYLGVKEQEAKAVLDAYGDTNWNSPVQVATLLFETLKLPVIRTGDSGKPSTDSDTLEALAKKHPLPRALLDYRKVVKLRGTYARGMLEHVRGDRIHPNIKLDGARSGRTSCIAGGTLVRTKRGQVPIECVRVGDLVWTHRMRWRRVTAVLDQGTKPTVRVRLGNGELLTCTSDHRLLSSQGVWKEAIAYAGKHEVGGGAWGRGSGALQGAGEPDDDSDRDEARDTFGERDGGACAAAERGGIPRAEVAEVQRFQDGRPEPDAREEWDVSPQLEGRVRGRKGLPHSAVVGEAQAGAPHRDDAGARGNRVAGGDVRAPHRRESEKQRARQPGARDCARTPAHSLLAGEGQRVVVVQEVQVGRGASVYDLSVEDDHSFSVCGVFAHNCTDPNLQNIPRAQSIEGKMARDCFAAPPGYVLLECDYSQLELRIAAALSGDPEMRSIFEAGVDYHLRTAQLVSQTAWGIPPEQVEDKHRSQAKSFNFGLLYGQGDAALAGNIGCTVAQASRIREAILGKFKVLDRWIKDQLAYATKHGHAWTSWEGKRARRRPLWRIADTDEAAASVARNSAHNTPIQGTASDFCIASLTECVRWIEGDNVEGVRLVLSIHDALLFEVREDLLHETYEQVMRIMQGWDSAGVPLVADAKAGPSWGSMEKYPPKAK